MPDILLISTADWDNPFWTNKQHTACELNRRGHRVLYVESLGIRRPGANTRDLRRVVRRVVRGLMPPREVRPDLWVWSPLVLPFHHVPFVRKINGAAFGMLYAIWSRILNFRATWLWTYSPLTSLLLGVERFDWSVYHCVDELTEQPRMPVELISSSEQVLCGSVDVVFTTSPELQRTKSTFNQRTFFFANVADFGHFNRALSTETKIPVDLERLAGPRIGFIGAISGYKIDFELLGAVAQARPTWNIVLIGEVGEGDPETDASHLREFPNIHLMGPRPYDTLPSYLRGFDVAILPNRLNGYTKSMFPMKLTEYMAAGRRVVSVELDALRDLGPLVRIARSHDEFIEAIEASLNDVEDIHSEARVQFAKANTYESRLTKMLAHSPIDNNETGKP